MEPSICREVFYVPLKFDGFTKCPQSLKINDYSPGTGESYSPTYARFSNLLYTAELCT